MLKLIISEENPNTLKEKQIAPEAGLRLFLKGKRPFFSLEKILHSEISIRSDVKCYLFIEGAPIDTQSVTYIIGSNSYDSKKGEYFCLNDKKDYFRDEMGFIQIFVKIKLASGEDADYCTDYIAIRVKPGEKRFEDVKDMLQYIMSPGNNGFDPSCLYHQYPAYLKTDPARRDRYRTDRETVFGKNSLLKGIIKSYESNLNFFAVNSRYRLEENAQVDRTARLQSVEADTLQYMARHPEYMRAQAGGIRIGMRYYLPEKILMKQNRISYDIYENRVVVAFLRKLLLDDIPKMKKSIEEFSALLSTGDKEVKNEKDGYRLSTDLLLNQEIGNLRKKIHAYDNDLQEAERKLQALFMTYRRILLVSDLEMDSLPKPTAILMRVPQYHELYEAMCNWYQQAGHEFAEEEFLMNFFDVPRIYEIYLLRKLLEAVEKKSFSFYHAERRIYGMEGIEDQESDADDNSEESNHKFDTEFSYRGNNTFRFRGSNGGELTIFYEPQVYLVKEAQDPEIPLYRSTTYPPGYLKDSGGSFYKPDYVIKYRIGNEVRLLICDAKYQELKKGMVKKQSGKDSVNLRVQTVQELAYKYLLSLNLSDWYAEVVGLIILYGKTETKKKDDKNQSYQSFFDKKRDGVPFFPEVAFVPVSPSVEDTYQEKSFDRMLRLLIDQNIP